jgi:SNF2 family DNA or RNA helicase
MPKTYTPKDIRDYQWRAFWWAFKKRFAALFLDMGLGKTIVVLSVIKAMFHKGLLTRPVLLVAPIRVIYGVWTQEAARWKHTRGLSFSIVHGSEQQRLDALKVQADIYLINPHNIRWLLRRMRSPSVRKNWPFGGLVIDESSAFKRAGAKRFRTLRHYVHLFDELRLILSGTPTPNSLEEIWSQMFIVDAGERLGTSIDRFRSRFFRPSFDGYGYELRDGSEEYVYDLIRDVALSMEAKDYLKDLPPTVINIVRVKLPARVRAMYDEFEREMFLELDSGNVEGLTAATVSATCWQIANGAVYVRDKETGERTGEWEPLHDAKLEALQEIIDETSDNCAHRVLVQARLLPLTYHAAQCAVLHEGQEHRNRGRVERAQAQKPAGPPGRHGPRHELAVWWPYNSDVQLDLEQRAVPPVHQPHRWRTCTVEGDGALDSRREYSRRSYGYRSAQ